MLSGKGRAPRSTSPTTIAGATFSGGCLALRFPCVIRFALDSSSLFVLGSRTFTQEASDPPSSRRPSSAAVLRACAPLLASAGADPAWAQTIDPIFRSWRWTGRGSRRHGRSAWRVRSPGSRTTVRRRRFQSRRPRHDPRGRAPVRAQDREHREPRQRGSDPQLRPKAPRPRRSPFASDARGAQLSIPRAALGLDHRVRRRPGERHPGRRPSTGPGSGSACASRPSSTSA